MRRRICGAAAPACEGVAEGEAPRTPETLFCILRTDPDESFSLLPRCIIEAESLEIPEE